MDRRWGAAVAASAIALAAGIAFAQRAAPGTARDDVRALIARIEAIDPSAADAPARLKQELLALARVVARLTPSESSEPPATGAAAPARSAIGPLFAKEGLQKYHRPGCVSGDRIAVGDRIWFASPRAASAAGLEACRVCKPDIWWQRRYRPR